MLHHRTIFRVFTLSIGMIAALTVRAQSGRTKPPPPDTVISGLPMTDILTNEQLHYGGHSEMGDEEIEQPQCGTLYQDAEPGGNVYPRAEGPCKDGKLNGTWKQYYSHRPWVWITCEYVNGKRNGNYFRYDQRGKVVQSRVYKNDSLEGDWKEFDKDGKVEFCQHYKNNKLDGLYEADDETIHYKNGLYDGKYIRWETSERKTKSAELLYEKGAIVSGTFFFRDKDTLATVQRVAPGEWRYYRYSYPKTGKFRIPGYVHARNDTAEFLSSKEDFIFDDGLQRLYFSMDSLWIDPHYGQDSVCWMYRKNQLTWNERWHRNDSGLVCLRARFYPMYRNGRRSNYSIRYEYVSAGPRTVDYRVNGKLLRHDEYYPKILIKSSRTTYDQKGQCLGVTRFFTDGSDSARWVFNAKTDTWICTWTTADSTLYGLRYYTKDSLRTGEWTMTRRKQQQRVTDTYVSGVLVRHAVLDAKNNVVEGGSYSNGQKTGSWIETGNDDTVSNGNYVNGLREGPWTEWYLYGQKKKASGTYTAGQKTGKWKTWDQDGKKQKNK